VKRGNVEEKMNGFFNFYLGRREENKMELNWKLGRLWEQRLLNGKFFFC
jgi:hypothetical protein